MAEITNIRRERLEKLLAELHYEIERGMLDGDLDETMGFRFIVPLSRRIPDGVVLCELRTRPISRYEAVAIDPTPRLRIVK